MDDVRLRRLQSDYESMRYLVRQNPRIQVESVTGNPPIVYRLLLQVHSMREQAGSLEFIDNHRIEIRLPLGYPKNAPVCRMLTPVFHPNVAPHAICVGDHWSAGESLDALVLRICEMLAFQSYNIKSPLNGEAARWVEEHLSSLPLDANVFYLEREPEPEILPDAEVVVRCDNCGQIIQEGGEKCDMGHNLCADCVVHCEVCSQLLCLVCNVIECPNPHNVLA